MKAFEYLIKQALPDPMGFVARKPFSSKLPDEYTMDDAKFMEKMYQGLPPSSRRTVGNTILKRREAGGQ